MSVRHRMQARMMLVRHYGAVFAHHWRGRRALEGGGFSEEEAEFLPAALEIQEKPVSPTLRATALILTALVLLLTGWACLGRMDIIVNATGEIIPRQRTKTVASIDVASVKALYVQEGQRVKKGDLLVELDASASEAEHDKAQGDATQALLTLARSRAMVEAVDRRSPPRLGPVPGADPARVGEARAQLDAQYRDFTAKLERTEAAIARYAQALPLVAQQAADYQALALNHDVPRHAYLEKEQARVDLAGQLADATNQRSVLIAETRRSACAEGAEARKVLGEARQDARRNAAHSRLLRLTAPVDGTVQQLSVFTVGGVVPAAQPLMKIVPSEQQIEVEAMLENKDIGFVAQGQPSAVKIDAYEYTKFGVLPAHVVHVSPDAIRDEKKGLLYSVTLVLDRPTLAAKGEELPLSAGMSVKADIKTGSRRVIEYFLSPLLQHKRESLNER